MEILAVIPARLGSKGLLDKNILPLRGHPLLAYSIVAATSADCVTRVICSTDSKKYAEIAIKYGAEVPFLRPKRDARDDSTDFDVFFHLLEQLQKNENYNPDIIIQLRPTSPLRYPGMIDDAILAFNNSKNADSLRAISYPDLTPYKMWRINKKNFMEPLLQIPNNPEPYNTNRQSLPEIYAQTGSIDVIRRNTITKKMSMTGTNILPFFIANKYFVDIDDQIGFSLCEILLNDLNYIKPTI